MSFFGLSSLGGALAGAAVAGSVVYGSMLAREKIVTAGAVRAERIETH